ncbi:MAG: DUF5615 family PIN-like protein [Chloroflexi bacterium]|nr:DUF5615 family PIN-like protein [Chloroflexota bacterium]
MAAPKFYFDEMIARPVAEHLQRRGIEVVMAVDAGMVEKKDSEHLVYTAEQGCVLVTFDRKFAGLTSQHTDHVGLICLTVAHQDDIGTMVRVLAIFVQQYTAEEAARQVFWLS